MKNKETQKVKRYDREGREEIKSNGVVYCSANNTERTAEK